MSDSKEKKRAYDRERVRRIREGMTAEQRADLRREHDRVYRDGHREERRFYDNERWKSRRKKDPKPGGD